MGTIEIKADREGIRGSLKCTISRSQSLFGNEAIKIITLDKYG